MKTYTIEDLSDDDLLSLLISEAHDCSVPSESNTLASIRDELKLRLTKRAADGDYCGCKANNVGRRINGELYCVACERPRR